MRIRALLHGDIRFQFKYGFYFIYLVFTILYVALLFALPAQWREMAGLLMIFTDPAAMGLYFMGAIILFEKSERVLNSLAVSPVKPLEYVISKVCSIAVISTVVALIIGNYAGIISNYAGFIIAVFFCSCIFSSLGIIVAAKITTLNEFIIMTIPVEILINVPAIAYIFGYKKSWLLFHPGVCMIEMCIAEKFMPNLTVIITFWAVIFAVIAAIAVKKMFTTVGGAKI